MDCSPLGSSVYRVFQGRILEWVAISFSRESSRPGIEAVSPALAGGFFTPEPPGKSRLNSWRLFFMVLEARSPKSRGAGHCGPNWEFLSMSVPVRALIPSCGLHPHDLIAFPIPINWGFSIWFEGHNSQSFKTASLKICDTITCSFIAVKNFHVTSAHLKFVLTVSTDSYIIIMCTCFVEVLI